MPVVWKPEYEVGIESVDEQHKHLVSLINKLEEAKAHENENEVIHDIFYELVDYTKYHFSEEEKFLKSFEYENLMVHKAQHKVLVKQIVDILNGLKKGEYEVGEKLTLMLQNWLIKHVLKHDKIYANKYLGN
ncbi:MAG: bacteriohemerythrin [Ignavibacteriae bacterium]|nr:bacteriohemerythrin [Ignavibacteriota bacterium]NOG98013.1 bacteriohemerythrin [Ignavibacteriota bacterium]